MDTNWLIIIALGSFLLAFLLVYLVWRDDRRARPTDATTRGKHDKASKRGIDYI